MGKKRNIQIPDDIFTKLVTQAPLGTTDYESVDNYKFTEDYSQKLYNADKYAVDDTKATNTYYDKYGNPQSTNKLDDASWYSKLFGEDTENKLLRISDDILYPDGSTATERETKLALEQGLDPEFAKTVGQSNAKQLAKEANARNGAIFDVLGVIGLGTYARSISSSMVQEQKLIPYFHPTLKKWVSKIATQDDFDAGAAVISAYGPKSDKDNFLQAFNKGFSNGLGSLPKSVARFNEWVGDLGEASINYLSEGDFKSNYGYVDKLADRLNAGYKRSEQQLAPNAQDNITSLEGLANGIGQGLSSLVQYSVTGGAATGFGSLTGKTALDLIGKGGVNALSKAGMLTAGFVLNGGEAYDTAKQAGLSEEEAALMALAVGAINTGIEMKVGSNKLQEYLIGARGAKEIPRIILQETGGDLSKLNKVSGNIISRVTKSFDDLTKIPILGTALEEGTEEFMQSLVSSTSQMLYNGFIANNDATEGKGAYEAKNFGEVFQQAFSEATIGALVGGIAGFGIKNDTAEKDSIMPFITSGKTDLIFSSLQELLDKGEITPETFDNYSSRITQLDNIWKTNGSIFQGINDNKDQEYDSESVKAYVLNLIDKEFTIKEKSKEYQQQITDIQNNSELSDAVKNEKIKEIKTLLNTNNLELQKLSKRISDFIPDETGNLGISKKQKAYNNIKDFIFKEASKILSLSENEIDVLLNYTNISAEFDSIIETTAINKGVIKSEDIENLKNIIGLNNPSQFIQNVLDLRQLEDKRIKDIKDKENKEKEKLAKEEEKQVKKNQQESKKKVKAAQVKKNEVAETEKVDDEFNLEEATFEEPPINEVPVPSVADIPLDEEEGLPAEFLFSADEPTTEDIVVTKILDQEEVSNSVMELKNDGLVRNPSDLESTTKPLRYIDETIKRTVGNTVISLNVDYVETILGDVENKANVKSIYNAYDEEGNIQINKNFDSRLQSPNQFTTGTELNIIIPTYDELNKDNYGINEYNNDINNVDYFPIAFTDSTGNIVGYLPTQENINKRVDPDHLEVELAKNKAFRETIFNNKDKQFTITITAKSTGSLIANRSTVKKSIYNALGNGDKLADGVVISIQKDSILQTAIGKHFDKKIINKEDLEDGFVYTVVPTAKKGSFIALPTDVSKVSREDATTVLKMIQLFKANPANTQDIDLIKERKDISNEVDFDNILQTLEAINSILYTSEKSDSHMLKFGKKLFLGVSKDLTFDWSDVMYDSATQDKIVDILSNRYYSVQLSKFGKSFNKYQLTNDKLSIKKYNNYFDYINDNSVITTNIQGIPVEGTDNEYYFTAQSVIEITDPVQKILQLEQTSEEDAEVKPTQEQTPAKKVIFINKFYPDKESENLNERQIGSVEKAIDAGIKAGKTGDEIYGILNALGFAPANLAGLEQNLREYLNDRVAGKDNRTFQETQSPTQEAEVSITKSRVNVVAVEEDKPVKKSNKMGIKYKPNKNKNTPQIDDDITDFNSINNIKDIDKQAQELMNKCRK